MSTSAKIRQIIQDVAGTSGVNAVHLAVCEVLSYDQPTRTCQVQEINGDATNTVENVLLMPSVDDGELRLPSVGSTVLVLKSDKTVYAVLQYGAIDSIYWVADQIQFGDGSYGGMIRNDVLAPALKANNDLLQAIINVLTGPPIDEPGSGAPSALQAALNIALAGQNLGDFTGMANENLTHGS
jgi:hypothetical protein